MFCLDVFAKFGVLTDESEEARCTPPLLPSSSGNRSSPNADDNASVTFLPSPPSSFPLRLAKKRKLELTPAGGHEGLQTRRPEFHEEIIIITDSDSER